MAANSLNVEPVADVEAPSRPVDCVGGSRHSSTVYEIQLAFLAARLAALETELERERGRRQRLRQRYEHLLAERDEEIRSLQREPDDGLLARLADL